MSDNHTRSNFVEALPPNIPVATLAVINLRRLSQGDEEEDGRLLETVTTRGFFYLDLRDCKDQDNVLHAVDDIYTLAEELFRLDEAEKLEYDVDRGHSILEKMKLNGYKPIGRNFGGVGCQRDGFESYAIPKDGVLDLGEQGSFLRPSEVDNHMETLRSFMALIQSASQAIYKGLSTALDVNPAWSFENFHRPDMPSPDLLRLLKYHPQPLSERGPPQAPHTDLGSLTFLFTRQPGLQVLPRGAKEWAYVAPKADHAIINLGDGMSLLSNGLLQSCLHRVSPLPFESFRTRYSFAYLQRAEDHTPMKGVQGGRIPTSDPEARVSTSAEWLAKKFSMLRGATHQANEKWILTGTEPVMSK